MNGEIGTTAKLTLAQHAGDLNTGMYSTFGPPLLIAALAVFALAIGLYILANIGEYIICWLLSKDEDDE